MKRTICCGEKPRRTENTPEPEWLCPNCNSVAVTYRVNAVGSN